MKKPLVSFASLALLGLTFAAPAAFAGNVGVSVHIGPPGVYAQVDIGRSPRRDGVVQRSVFVRPPAMRGPVVVVAQPAYRWGQPHRPVRQARWSQDCDRHGTHQGVYTVPVYYVQGRGYGERERGHPVHHGR